MNEDKIEGNTDVPVHREEVVAGMDGWREH